MSAPLYFALSSFRDADPLRLHMPGHKGRIPEPFGTIAALDVTELAPTGNLYTGEGAVSSAEELCARAAGAADALFFSCGSTQGIYTMLMAAVGIDGTLILERGCHKSVTNGMALLNITPHYICTPALGDSGLPAPLTPEVLEPYLKAHPNAKAVFLTSPSYYGVITDIAPLAQLCHRYGTYLLVDQAHGAHFPFVGLSSAVEEGADLAVVSTHKTWPALGSSSVLYRRGEFPVSKAVLKEMCAVFATTSPSWPILASIDCARDYLEGVGGAAYRRAAEMTNTLRRRINEETPFHALTEADGAALDPCRLTVDTRCGGLSGKEVDELLQKENIYLEMADDRYIVAIITCNDRQEDLDRLFSALVSLPAAAPLESLGEVLPPLPRVRTSIRKALFGTHEPCPLKAAAGRISAEILAPYPPGIPVVAPGEEITEKHIAYLQKKSYNIEGAIAVLSE